MGKHFKLWTSPDNIHGGRLTFVWVWMIVGQFQSPDCFSPSLDLNHQSSRWSNRKVQLPSRSGTWTWPYNQAPFKTKTWIGILLHLNYFSNFQWQTVHFQKHKRQVVIFSHVSMMWPFLHTTKISILGFVWHRWNLQFFQIQNSKPEGSLQNQNLYKIPFISWWLIFCLVISWVGGRGEKLVRLPCAVHESFLFKWQKVCMWSTEGSFNLWSNCLGLEVLSNAWGVRHGWRYMLEM